MDGHDGEITARPCCQEAAVNLSNTGMNLS